MTEHIKNPLSGKLRGVTYEDGKIIDVHIRDTDDLVKVFVPVRHGRWIEKVDNVSSYLSGCEELFVECSVCHAAEVMGSNYCPNCGAKMDLEVKNAEE